MRECNAPRSDLVLDSSHPIQPTATLHRCQPWLLLLRISCRQGGYRPSSRLHPVLAKLQLPICNPQASYHHHLVEACTLSCAGGLDTLYPYHTTTQDLLVLIKLLGEASPLLPLEVLGPSFPPLPFP